MYQIYQAERPRYPVATIEAGNEYDALARWAIDQGFADPRQFRGTDEDYFYVMFDGTIGMTFTNTDMWAVPAA